MSTPFKETAKLFFEEIVPFTLPQEASESCSVVEGWGPGEGSHMWGGACMALRTTSAKERAPRFRYQLAQVWSGRERGSGEG